MIRPRLSDRVVVLVGAASGIGAATAATLVRQRARVVLGDVRRDALLGVLATARQHGQAIGVVTDVTDVDTLDQLREEALQVFGRVDAVINCAAVLVPGAVDALPLHDLSRQVNTNLLGTILVSRAFLPYFRARGAGHLIHLASLGGIVPMPQEATYSATKFAVRGFCLALALELHDTAIRVSVVCPDSTNTPQLAAEARPEGSPMSFLGAPLTPERVARVILETLRHPRLEVAVPRGRGWPAKLVALSPGLLRLAYPLLERWGSRRRDRFAGGAPVARATRVGVA